MVKGVNRSVIEINETGNQYIERAILFINTKNISDKKSADFKALEYLNNLSLPKYCRKTQSVKRRKKDRIIRLIVKILSAVSLVMVGAVIAYIFK